MSLPSFDKLIKMTDEELLVLLDQETERVIQSAPSHKQDRLRCIANRCRMQAQASKNPTDRMIRASNLMHESFNQLNELLKQFRK